MVSLSEAAAATARLIGELTDPPMERGDRRLVIRRACAEARVHTARIPALVSDRPTFVVVMDVAFRSGHLIWTPKKIEPAAAVITGIGRTGRLVTSAAAFTDTDTEVVFGGKTAETSTTPPWSTTGCRSCSPSSSGVSLILLTVVFRSLVLSLTAVALNLLSVGAAYGRLVLVFLEGYGADLLGLQQVDRIEAWVPVFLFSVLFALSMDYHVFLLTRIRERYLETGDTVEAVVHGIAATGRIITGAALIIVVVFAGFAAGKLVMFQQMGFGIAVALLLDATIIRSVVLPAALGLLDRRSWYLPRWLEWLPRVEVERPVAAPPVADL